MSVALYIDENVHRGITDGLRIRGNSTRRWAD